MKVTVEISVADLIDEGVWPEVANARGINPDSVPESMRSETIVKLDGVQAHDLDLINLYAS
jgi:hypothetical protein